MKESTVYTITNIDTEHKLEKINKMFKTQLRKIPVEVTIKDDKFIKRADDGTGTFKESFRVPFDVWESFIGW